MNTYDIAIDPTDYSVVLTFEDNGRTVPMQYMKINPAMSGYTYQ